MVAAQIIREEEQQLVVAFIDDTDFVSKGEDYTKKMQFMLDKYTRLYKVTGGYVQHDKTSF